MWTACSWAAKKEENVGVLVGKRKTRAVLSAVVPRKSTGDWICRRLREVGLEFVDLIVTLDNEPVPSLIESWFVSTD